MVENSKPGSTTASLRPRQVSSNNNNNNHYQLPHEPKSQLDQNNNQTPSPPHCSTTPKPTTITTSNSSSTLSSPRTISTPSALNHPAQGGKWINPELVHDNIGHPTLGGTYPAGRPYPGGRRFSKRIAQKKWLARIIASPRDKEIGAFADTDVETEIETGPESGMESSTIVEKSEEDVDGTASRVLKGISE